MVQVATSRVTVTSKCQKTVKKERQWSIQAKNQMNIHTNEITSRQTDMRINKKKKKKKKKKIEIVKAGLRFACF